MIEWQEAQLARLCSFVISIHSGFFHLVYLKFTVTILAKLGDFAGP